MEDNTGSGTDPLEVGVVVVGAGLAGLAAAAVAARAGTSVAVLDTRAPGGRARSDEREGYLLNQGPHALYRAGAGAGVLDRLGVAATGAPPYARPRAYVEATGRLDRLPTSGRSLVRTPLLGAADKVRLGRLLLGLPRVDAASLAPRSAADWIGSLELAPRGVAVLSTLVRVATYAPDLDRIAADAAVGQLQLVLEGNVRYLDGGWQTLVDGLVATAETAGARMLEGQRAVGIVAGDDGTWLVATPGRALRASAVVVAAGGPDAARALLPDAPRWDLGDPATAACLDLGLGRPPTTRAAFGLDEPLYLSTHAPSARLAPDGGAMVHVARYGARTSDRDREQLWALARRCGVADRDVLVRRFLHAMTVCHALPRPGGGLAGRPTVTDTGSPGLWMAGDWVGPVGLLADAALASGEAAGRAAAARAAGSAVATGGPAVPTSDMVRR